jgi:hypothetical protein
MVDVIDLFDNREKAVGIWLLVFAIGALCIRDVRRQVPGLLKTMFGATLVIPFLLAVAYVSGVVIGLAEIGLWSRDLLDVTLFWFFGAGLWMFGTVGLHGPDPELFGRIIRRRLLAAVLVIEFVANLYVFNLAVELMLVPGVVFLVLLDAAAETKPEYARVKTITEGALAVFGVFLLVRAANIVLSDPGSFATSETVMRFLLPILLSAAFLPFVYLLALWVLYEQAFTRLDHFASHPRIARRRKWAMVRTFALNRRTLLAFAGPDQVKLARAESDAEIKRILQTREAA